MRSEEDIRRTLEAWKSDPYMDECDCGKDAKLAGQNMINMLRWILEEI